MICAAVFRKDHALIKELRRDDDSTKSHRARAAGRNVRASDGESSETLVAIQSIKSIIADAVAGRQSSHGPVDLGGLVDHRMARQTSRWSWPKV
jgi:hypothetical protein